MGWGFGNNACDGGEDWRVYKFLLAHQGIPTEDSYGPYLGNDAECRINDTNIEIGFQIKGYVNVTSGSNEATQVAIAKHGPLSVSIDAGAFIVQGFILNRNVTILLKVWITAFWL